MSKVRRVGAGRFVGKLRVLCCGAQVAAPGDDASGLMLFAAPEGDLAAVPEAHVFIEFYGARVGEGYVEEGGYV